MQFFKGAILYLGSAAIIRECYKTYTYNDFYLNKGNILVIKPMHANSISFKIYDKLNKKYVTQKNYNNIFTMFKELFMLTYINFNINNSKEIKFPKILNTFFFKKIIIFNYIDATPLIQEEAIDQLIFNRITDALDKLHQNHISYHNRNILNNILLKNRKIYVTNFERAFICFKEDALNDDYVALINALNCHKTTGITLSPDIRKKIDLSSTPNIRLVNKN